MGKWEGEGTEEEGGALVYGGRCVCMTDMRLLCAFGEGYKLSGFCVMDDANATSVFRMQCV